VERTGQLGLAFDGHFGPPFTKTLNGNIERTAQLR